MTPIEKLRSTRWGVRLLGVVGVLFHVPLYLWLTRADTAFAYRLYWQAIKTGGTE